ncbi:MAG TPA: GNAT family protein [Motilibacteraceae bacterium]|nr:GNAT family protein [Motilibacteraceae bacterium]
MLSVARLSVADAADLLAAGLAGSVAALRGVDEALHGALIEQAAGTAHYFVVRDDGALVARVDLTDVARAGPDAGAGLVATLGYQVAEGATGRGIGTAAVGIVLDLAARELGVSLVVAVTARGNVASQKVLSRNGFVKVGDLVEPDGARAMRYEKVLR